MVLQVSMLKYLGLCWLLYQAFLSLFVMLYLTSWYKQRKQRKLTIVKTRWNNKRCSVRKRQMECSSNRNWLWPLSRNWENNACFVCYKCKPFETKHLSWSGLSCASSFTPDVFLAKTLPWYFSQVTTKGPCRCEESPKLWSCIWYKLQFLIFIVHRRHACALCFGEPQQVLQMNSAKSSEPSGEARKEVGGGETTSTHWKKPQQIRVQSELQLKHVRITWLALKDWHWHPIPNDSLSEGGSTKYCCKGTQSPSRDR